MIGIIIGATYSLLALGFNIIYGTTGTFHVSHGALYTLLIYIKWTIYSQFSSSIVGILVAFALGLVTAIALGYLINNFFYSYFRKKGTSRMVEFVGSFGLAIVIESLVAIVWDPNPKSFDTNLTNLQTIGGINWSPFYTLVIIILGGTFLFAYIFLYKTLTGRKIRGLATNPELVEVIGVDEKKLYNITFIVGTMISAPAALIAGINTSFEPHIGSSIIFIAAVIVIMGGIGNLVGTLVTGLALGLLQSISSLFLTGTWQYTIAFIAFFVVIVLRPEGLFGSFKLARE